MSRNNEPAKDAVQKFNCKKSGTDFSEKNYGEFSP